MTHLLSILCVIPVTGENSTFSLPGSMEFINRLIELFFFIRIYIGTYSEATKYFGDEVSFYFGTGSGSLDKNLYSKKYKSLV
jgi:hypothetical protein